MPPANEEKKRSAKHTKGLDLDAQVEQHSFNSSKKKAFGALQGFEQKAEAKKAELDKLLTQKIDVDVDIMMHESESDLKKVPIPASLESQLAEQDQLMQEFIQFKPEPDTEPDLPPRTAVPKLPPVPASPVPTPATKESAPMTPARDETKRPKTPANRPGPKKVRAKPTAAAKYSTKTIRRMQLKMVDWADITKEQLVGDGAYGQVWRGTYKENTVAVKVVKSLQGAPTVEQISEFQAEAALMCSIAAHPNVISTYGIALNPPAILMDYMALGNLKDYALENSLPGHDLVRIFAGIAAGMNHLHTQSIVHRDLAARNILLNYGLQPKITDFGLSRKMEGQQKYATTKANVGPARWMAPECILRREYSRASDVWSFGCLIWEILEGEDPLPQLHVAEVIVSVTVHKVTPEIFQDYPETLKALLKACFKYEPGERPTFRDVIVLLEKSNLAHELEQWQSGDGEEGAASEDEPATLTTEPGLTDSGESVPIPTHTSAEVQEKTQPGEDEAVDKPPTANENKLTPTPTTKPLPPQSDKQAQEPQKPPSAPPPTKPKAKALPKPKEVEPDDDDELEITPQLDDSFDPLLLLDPETTPELIERERKKQIFAFVSLKERTGEARKRAGGTQKSIKMVQQKMVELARDFDCDRALLVHLDLESKFLLLKMAPDFSRLVHSPGSLFLEFVGLSQHCVTFFDKDIDTFDALKGLTAKQLDQMKIPEAHRTKILRHAPSAQSLIQPTKGFRWTRVKAPTPTSPSQANQAAPNHAPALTSSADLPAPPRPTSAKPNGPPKSLIRSNSGSTKDREREKKEKEEREGSHTTNESASGSEDGSKPVDKPQSVPRTGSPSPSRPPPKSHNSSSKLQSERQPSLPEKSGRLAKLHGKNWVERYFVVKAGGIFRYTDAEGKLKDAIFLDPTVTADEYDPATYQNAFQIQSSQLKKLKLVLKAETEFEMHKWLNAIWMHKFNNEQTGMTKKQFEKLAKQHSTLRGARDSRASVRSNSRESSKDKLASPTPANPANSSNSPSPQSTLKEKKLKKEDSRKSEKNSSFFTESTQSCLVCRKTRRLLPCFHCQELACKNCTRRVLSVTLGWKKSELICLNCLPDLKQAVRDVKAAKDQGTDASLDQSLAFLQINQQQVRNTTDGDSSDEIVWEDESKEIVKAANLYHLVSWLARTNLTDEIQSFLLVFSYFATPLQVMNAVDQIYSNSHNQAEKLRTLNFIKTWFQQYPEDTESKEFQVKFSEFSAKLLSEEDRDSNGPIKAALQNIEKVKERSPGDRGATITLSRSVKDAPKIMIQKPSKLSQQNAMFIHHSQEIARQMTLRAWTAFNTIRPRELTKQAWTKNAAPHLKAFVESFNQVCSWVRTEIVMEYDRNVRVRLIEKFIEILDDLLGMQNYHTLAAIVGGLGDPSVHRLKATWKKVNQKLVKRFVEITDVCSPINNFKALRDALARATREQLPCIPYIGMHLTDLTFIEDGNPSMLGPLVNYFKFRLLATQITGLQLQQSRTFNFTPVSEVQLFLDRTTKNQYSASECYSCSLLLESEDD